MLDGHRKQQRHRKHREPVNQSGGFRAWECIPLTVVSDHVVRLEALRDHVLAMDGRMSHTQGRRLSVLIADACDDIDILKEQLDVA